MKKIVKIIRIIMLMMFLTLLGLFIKANLDGTIDGSKNGIEVKIEKKKVDNKIPANIQLKWDKLDKEFKEIQTKYKFNDKEMKKIFTFHQLFPKLLSLKGFKLNKDDIIHPYVKTYNVKQNIKLYDFKSNQVAYYRKGDVIVYINEFKIIIGEGNKKLTIELKKSSNTDAYYYRSSLRLPDQLKYEYKDLIEPYKQIISKINKKEILANRILFDNYKAISQYETGSVYFDSSWERFKHQVSKDIDESSEEVGGSSFGWLVKLLFYGITGFILLSIFGGMKDKFNGVRTNTDTGETYTEVEVVIAEVYELKESNMTGNIREVFVGNIYKADASDNEYRYDITLGAYTNTNLDKLITEIRASFKTRNITVKMV